MMERREQTPEILQKKMCQDSPTSYIEKERKQNVNEILNWDNQCGRLCLFKKIRKIGYGIVFRRKK